MYNMKNVVAIVIILVFAGMVRGCATETNDFDGNDQQGVQIDLDEQEGTATVRIGGEHFTTYRFGEDFRIPILWPVIAEGGVTVTRNWPMGDDEPESRGDHPHQRSIWTAFGDVNGFDHWREPPVGLPIISQGVKVSSGDDSGVISARNTWVDDAGDPLVDDFREYRFYNSPASARIFDQKITFRASYGDVTFGDDKEGLIAFRIRPEIKGNRAGILTNARGRQGEQKVYETPTEWMDYSGHIEGVGHRGIALFVHPDNFRLPAWHVRDYGLVGCNFFAMNDVAGLEDGTYTLPHGAELTIYVRFLIHSGDVDAAGVQEHYEEYANTPVKAW